MCLSAAARYATIAAYRPTVCIIHITYCMQVCMYVQGLVSMGSMGSAEPINFERRVLNPSILEEIQ